MDRIPKLSRRARWAVPAGALAITGAVIAGALVSSAQASPVLPARTAAQLLAAVSGGNGSLPAFTGSVVETANLGLPNLPGTDDATSTVSLLTGSHTIRIWYANADHVRLAVPGNMSESDFVLNGRTAWLWQSTTNSVTRFLLPADHHQVKQPVLPALTPQQAANQAIKAVGPSTRVSVQTNVTVAGEPAYQLVLAPKSTGSLIGQVRIAVDATHHVPLRVQVYARHATSPGFQVGFQSVSFVQPAASNFTFSPPPGAKVHTQRLTDADAAEAMPQRASEPDVIGQNWLAVAVLPAGGMPGMPGHAASAGGVASSAARSASNGTPGGAAPGEDGALFATVLHTAKPVHGAWGSGQLLRTSMLSMLVLSNGKMLLGAVTPSVLYADAAHVR